MTLHWEQCHQNWLIMMELNGMVDTMNHNEKILLKSMLDF